VGRWSKDGTSPGPAEEIAIYLNWTAATTLWQLRDTVASPVVDPAIPVSYDGASLSAWNCSFRRLHSTLDAPIILTTVIVLRIDNTWGRGYEDSAETARQMWKTGARCDASKLCTPNLATPPSHD
jgi:hypothetical protein